MTTPAIKWYSSSYLHYNAGTATPATAPEDYVDRIKGRDSSLIVMQPHQQTAECIIEIRQDTKKEDTENFVVTLDLPTTPTPLAEVTLHPTDFTTTIYILDDEGTYILGAIIVVESWDHRP